MRLGGRAQLGSLYTDLKGTQLIKSLTDGDDYKPSFLRFNSSEVGKKKFKGQIFMFVDLSPLAFFFSKCLFTYLCCSGC